MRRVYLAIAVVLCAAPCTATDPNLYLTPWQRTYSWVLDPLTLPDGLHGNNCGGGITQVGGFSYTTPGFAFNKDVVLDQNGGHPDSVCWQSDPMGVPWLISGGVDLYRQQFRHIHVTDKPPAQTPCHDHGLFSQCDMDGIRVCRLDAVLVPPAPSGSNKKQTPCGMTGDQGCAVCQQWFWPESP